MRNSIESLEPARLPAPTHLPCRAAFPIISDDPPGEPSPSAPPPIPLEVACMNRISRTAGLLPRLLLAATLLVAWGAGRARAEDRWAEMDYGRFLTASISARAPAKNDAMKGIAIRLGTDREAAICFDQDLLRVSAAWTGKFLNLNGTPFDGGHGSWPSVAGEQQFGTSATPGWARGDDLADPRPEPFGSLPADWARYSFVSVR